MLRVGSNAISETIDGEVVMIDLATGLYYSLTGTAGQVWSALEAGGGRTGTLAAMTARYGDDVAPSVDAFIDQLLAEGVVVEAAGDDAAVPAIDGQGSFETPVLDRYTDMAGILCIDPIHEVDEEVGWPRAR